MTKSNEMAASRQWSSRPLDQRFWGFDDCLPELQRYRDEAQEFVGPLKTFKARPTDEGDVVLYGKDGLPIEMTHHSFGQLTTRIGAPARYLRELPADLVARNLNHGLSNPKAERSEAQFLIRRPSEGNGTLRALTTDLARVWSYDVAKDLSVLGQVGWRIPPARPCMTDPRARKATAADILPNQKDFGLSIKVGDTIAPAGIYASDKDFWVLLVNMDRWIDTGTGGGFRGVMVSNSEVGAGLLECTCFLFENVCGNHIIWGASELVRVAKRHVGSIFEMINERRKIVEGLRGYANVAGSREELMIKAARARELGSDKPKAIKALMELAPTVHNLSEATVTEVFGVAEQHEKTAGSSAATVWGFVHGLTRWSQAKGNLDSRHAVDAAGGALLNWVYPAEDPKPKALPKPKRAK